MIDEVNVNAARKKSGMVLVTVLMAITTMSIFLIFIITQNLSQSTISQAQLDQSAQREWCQGALAACFNTVAAGGTCGTIGPDRVGAKQCTSTPVYDSVSGQITAQCNCS